MVKLFDVFGCQVDQVGILAVIPNLFNWIKVRRILQQKEATIQHGRSWGGLPSISTVFLPYGHSIDP